MNVRISEIVLEIGDEQLILTLKQAKELQDALNEALVEKEVFHTRPTQYPWIYTKGWCPDENEVTSSV